MVPRALALVLAALALLAPGPMRAAEPSWEAFKAHFMTLDGRVMDPFHDNMSHSEGQGYAMLLAEAHGDREAFDLLWHWTRDNLQARETDALLAWSFGQRLPGQWRVMDFNNATDGDILVAYALLKAWERWGEDSFRDEALRMAADIRQLLVVEQQGRLILLPGYFGFHDSAMARHNPSYVVYPALDLFAQYDDAQFWPRLKADSLAILAQVMPQGPALPPDWVELQGGAVVRAYSGEATQGFESVRVILYLAWAGELQSLPGLDELLQMAAGQDSLPIVTEDGTQALAIDSMPQGFLAVLARAAQESGREEIAAAIGRRADLESAAPGNDYYSSVLALLSAMDQRTAP